MDHVSVTAVTALLALVHVVMQGPTVRPTLAHARIIHALTGPHASPMAATPTHVIVHQASQAPTVKQVILA